MTRALGAAVSRSRRPSHLAAWARQGESPEGPVGNVDVDSARHVGDAPTSDAARVILKLADPPIRHRTLEANGRGT